MVPFGPLAELPPHEEQFLAGLAVHVPEEEPEVGELLPVVPGHFGQERPLAVHHFVMGEGQKEIFVKGIEHPEGQGVVVILPEDRVHGQIFQGVVHPSHVPLEAEAQAPDVDGAGDHGPVRGLLGRGLDIGEALVDFGVELAQKGDGFQVLPAAVLVGHPFPRFPGIIQVEHGGHGVHPEAVGVVAVQPEQGAAHEKAPDLVSAVIENGALPVGMKPPAGVGVLIEVGAVEEAEAVFVRREVGGHPVQDDADAVADAGSRRET